MLENQKKPYNGTNIKKENRLESGVSKVEKPNYVYDIRTSESAARTLKSFTGVDISIWNKYISQQKNYPNTDDFVRNVLAKYGHMPPDLKKWSFTYFHISTSANQCENFRKQGILDLKNTYSCLDSELRMFLDNKEIRIDLSKRILKYKKHEYNIEYVKTPYEFNSQEKACWLIGRKFYYDYTTCGFLSIDPQTPYLGEVHRRPEILSDIDNLLKLNLSEEWSMNHYPFEIVAMVQGSDIVCDAENDQDGNDRIINYLAKAYYAAFDSPSEEIILLKNGVHVKPKQIIEISPLKCWKM